jgi:hypothetical protein
MSPPGRDKGEIAVGFARWPRPETRVPSLRRLCLIAACGGHSADPGEKPGPGDDVQEEDWRLTTPVGLEKPILFTRFSKIGI